MQAVYNEVPTVAVAGPSGEVPVDRVRLSWRGEDGDGERLEYVVRVWREGVEEPVVDEILDVEELGLEHQLAEGVYRWTVEVSDGWGPGDEAAEGQFTVIPVPEPVRACSTAPVAGWWGLAPGLLLLLARRRKSAERHGGQ